MLPLYILRESDGIAYLRPSDKSRMLDESNWHPRPAFRGLETVADSTVRVCDKYTLGIAYRIHIDQAPFDALLPEYWRGGKTANRGLELMRYRPGGHFVKHVDSQSGPGHFATLLVFPPAEGFEGGELIIYDGPTPIVIEPAKFTVWTQIAIRIGVEHEVRPVLSGIRYVIKAELYVQDEFLELSCSTDKAVTPTIETYRDAYTADIEEIERQIATLAAAREALVAKRAAVTSVDTCLPEVRGVMERIKETIDELWSPCPVYMLLKRMYKPGAKPADLVGADVILFHEIKKEYSTATIVARCFTWDFSEVNESSYRERFRAGKTDFDLVMGAVVENTHVVGTEGSTNCKIIQWDPFTRPPVPGYLYDGYTDQSYMPSWSTELIVAIRIM